MSVQKKGVSVIEMFYVSAKDLADLYGCHIQTGRQKLSLIKDSLGKESQELVSLEEFAMVAGFSIEFVQHFKEQQFR